jgi:hypothetical protein
MKRMMQTCRNMPEQWIAHFLIPKSLSIVCVVSCRTLNSLGKGVPGTIPGLTPPLFTFLGLGRIQLSHSATAIYSHSISFECHFAFAVPVLKGSSSI